MKLPSSNYDRSNVNRVLKTLNYEEPDRVPHIELRVTSRAVYEYVLERRLDIRLVTGGRRPVLE